MYAFAAQYITAQIGYSDLVFVNTRLYRAATTKVSVKIFPRQIRPHTVS